MELLVLAGEDAGRRFTLSRPQILVARRDPQRAQPGAILLSDRTVSLRQATLLSADGECFIEHHADATNPTTVNGAAITRVGLAVGDKIGMGHVLLEVHERAVSQFGQAKPAAASQPTTIPDADDPAPADNASSRSTESRPVPGPRARLSLLSGTGGKKAKSFEITARATKIGRSSQCDVSIEEAGVSRLHAEIVLEGEDFILIHRSGTNSTSVNGNPMPERLVLYSGDHIQLADRILLVFERVEAAGPHKDSLWRRMEDEVERNRRIEDEFGAFGSFLDICVVAPYRMKQSPSTAGHVVVSFERWRAWVEQILSRMEGQMLNSNGDELMCFFESPLQAVRAASQVLSELEAFNAEQNLLKHDFAVRMGVHTGHSLVDRSRGVAYSAVLDLATHLQQQSEPNSLLISAETHEKLPDGMAFEAAGSLEESGLTIYRLTGAAE